MNLVLNLFRLNANPYEGPDSRSASDRPVDPALGLVLPGAAVQAAVGRVQGEPRGVQGLPHLGILGQPDVVAEVLALQEPLGQDASSVGRPADPLPVALPGPVPALRGLGDIALHDSASRQVQQEHAARAQDPGVFLELAEVLLLRGEVAPAGVGAEDAVGAAVAEGQGA